MVTASEQKAVERFDSIMNQMNQSREEWLKDDEDDDDDNGKGNGILQQAITLALEEGRGWKPGEKEAYLQTLLDDDYIPPIFANTVQEVEQMGLTEAFTSLIYDEEANPIKLMHQFKKRGLDSFATGKRNVVKNMQYYRDAINFWYEARAWGNKITTIEEGDYAYADYNDPEDDEHGGSTMNAKQRNIELASICNNIALAHMQLGNWGHVRTECNEALKYDTNNIKTYYRLAVAYEKLKDYENAGTAIDSALQIDSTNKDVLKLQKQLYDKIQKARTIRQQRERARAERIAQVKAVWRHCNGSGGGGGSSNNNSNTKRILLGRVPLVSTTTDDDIDGMNDEDDNIPNGQSVVSDESRWHQHLPHTGLLPKEINNSRWSWPCMFVYPSHNQSDFIKEFYEDDILAIRMAQVFPELEEDDEDNENDDGQKQQKPTLSTAMPWDYRNEFVCSQLAVYFEVHEEAIQHAATIPASDTNTTTKKKKKGMIVQHPDTVELLYDQATCMKYYESSRALLGDEGIEIANVIRKVEQQHLYKQRKVWKQKHKSLWCKPDPCPVVRIHPAVSLYDIVTDPRMVVPSFLVTVIMIPENNPYHEQFLKERKCIGLLEPK